jgi:hypothetical protein
MKPIYWLIVFIVGGMVFAGGLGLWLSNICSISGQTSSYRASEQSNEHPTQQKDATGNGLNRGQDIGTSLKDIANSLSAINRRQQERDTSEINQHPQSETTLCNIRIADLALIYFTYCLVVVGFFTMRSAETSAQQIERAFLFGGGGPVQVIGTHVHGIMHCLNSGRSNAILKEYYFGWSATEPTGTPTYPPTAIHSGGKEDLICAPDKVVLLADNPIDISKTSYCFGFFKYKDIFGIDRESYFACRFVMMPPNTVRSVVVGGDAWNRWT